VWRARIAEVGFALPPGTTEHTVTSDGKWRLQSVAGVDGQLQYFIVRLGSNADTRARDVLVVCAYHPPLSDEAIALNVTAMAAQYPARDVGDRDDPHRSTLPSARRRPAVAFRLGDVA
jgi:hypothetical protein